MKPTFLCAKHKAWLNSQPEQAIYNCSSTCEAGWMLYQQERWQEALPYIGSAFETSEILLTTRAITAVSAIEWFLHTLAGLTQTLKKLGYVDACKSVYQTAIDRLTQELENNEVLKTPIALQINRLTSELKNLNYSGQGDTFLVNMITQNKGSTVLH